MGKKKQKLAPPSAEQVQRIAEAMPDATTRAAVMVAAYSGLRIAELCALEWDDVIWEDGKILLHVRYGKGGKERYSLLLKPGKDALGDHHPDTNGPLFVRPDGEAHDRFSLSRRFVEAKRKVDYGQFVFHSLRKFHATQLLNAGVSDMDVAFQLGHTDRMGRPNPKMVREIYGYPEASRALDRVALTMEGS